jgi:hypothetical protein
VIGHDDWAIDAFIHRISATDGLPPYSQARIIDLISDRLRKHRAHPCLWVSVDTPGIWYVQELDRLVKRKIPTIILPAGQKPASARDFKPRITIQYKDLVKEPHVPAPFDVEKYGLKSSTLRVLRILARLKTAHTPEITSLAAFSETHVRALLKRLQADELIERRRIGKYDGWAISNRGLRLAQRSWNIPKGARFAKYRTEYRYAAERHRRVARTWRAWLETAYEDVKIWECWTEVPVNKGIPDALAWGTFREREMLFWLEVDSGKSSRKTMRYLYQQRIHRARRHAFSWDLPMVFCILGPDWVVKDFQQYIPFYSLRLAMIGHDWRYFGKLPQVEFGAWHDDLNWSHFLRATRKGIKLSFNPAQYPRKPKGRTQEPPKPKSTKPKFRSPNYDEGESWSSSRLDPDD